MCDHVWSCVVIFGHVWLCLVMCGHGWSCLHCTGQGCWQGDTPRGQESTLMSFNPTILEVRHCYTCPMPHCVWLCGNENTVVGVSYCIAPLSVYISCVVWVHTAVYIHTHCEVVCMSGCSYGSIYSAWLVNSLHHSDTYIAHNLHTVHTMARRVWPEVLQRVCDLCLLPNTQTPFHTKHLLNQMPSLLLRVPTHHNSWRLCGYTNTYINACSLNIYQCSSVSVLSLDCTVSAGH